ncbi:MAG: hypothetical protein AAB289_07980, partial [Chloroflexota bacterium]
FPGETGDDFEATLSLLRRARFDGSFSFASSPLLETDEIDDERPDTLYMTPRSGDLYASFDRGESWTTLSPKLPDVQDMKLVHV